VPTFDNGWICRECWCANREQDHRCYRCHVVRPEYAAAAEEPVVAASAEAAPDAPEPTGPPPGVIRRLAGAESAADAQPSGRFCLTCGRKLLPGASFCTQCGSRSADDEAVTEPLQAHHDHAANARSDAEPIAAAKRERPAMPTLDVRAGLNRIRVGYLDFIARHALRWDVALAGLAVLFVISGTAGERLGGAVGGFLFAAQWALTILFVAEYGTRLAASTDRRDFVMAHPAELVALVPQLRAVRVLALLRWLGIPDHARRVSARFATLTARARRSARYLLAGLWVILVFLGVAMLYQYTGSSPTGVDRFLAIAAGAVVVCLISAVTASLTTTIVLERRAGDDVANRARILAELKDAGLWTGDASAHEDASTHTVSAPAGRVINPTRPIRGLSAQR
jgi:hypothetical protein